MKGVLPGSPPQTQPLGRFVYAISRWNCPSPAIASPSRNTKKLTSWTWGSLISQTASCDIGIAMVSPVNRCYSFDMPLLALLIRLISPQNGQQCSQASIVPSSIPVVSLTHFLPKLWSGHHSLVQREGYQFLWSISNPYSFHLALLSLISFLEHDPFPSYQHSFISE
jgi:hypothetical protein